MNETQHLTDYFRREFSSDLRELVRATETMKYSEHAREPIPGLQAHTVGLENPAVAAWPLPRRALFAAALFYAVLIDEAFYTYFRFGYNQFQKATKYPKLLGNCLSLCHYHRLPANALNLVGANEPPSGVGRFEVAARRRLVLESAAGMESEFLEMFESMNFGALFRPLWRECLRHVIEEEVAELC